MNSKANSTAQKELQETLARMERQEKIARRRSVLYSSLPVLVGLIVLGITYYQVRTAEEKHNELEQQNNELNQKIIAKEQRVESLTAFLTDLGNRIADLSGSGEQVQEVKEQAKFAVAWTKYPPKRAWCYQEQDRTKPRQSEFSIHCHWSQERCNQAKAGSKIATACGFVQNLEAAEWSPNPKGRMDSWYHVNRKKQLPPPFPQIPLTIAIASWDIEQFGETKSSDAVNLARIANVVKQFDVIAIQEIVHAASQGQDVVDRLTSELQNKHHRNYDYVLGPRTGCPGGRIEQSAVLFHSEILELVNSRTVADDPNETDNMCRDPLVVKLKIRDTTATLTFTLIVVHTDPSPSSALRRDLNALGRIYQVVQANDPQDDDVILLGSLNAEPSCFEGLGNVPDLVYALPGTGTMLLSASRNDNIVFQSGPTAEDYTGRALVFRVAQFLGISEEDADRLSDHQPVYAVFFAHQDTR